MSKIPEHIRRVAIAAITNKNALEVFLDWLQEHPEVIETSIIQPIQEGLKAWHDPRGITHHLALLMGDFDLFAHSNHNGVEFDRFEGHFGYDDPTKCPRCKGLFDLMAWKRASTQHQVKQASATLPKHIIDLAIQAVNDPNARLVLADWLRDKGMNKIADKVEKPIQWNASGFGLWGLIRMDPQNTFPLLVAINHSGRVHTGIHNMDKPLECRHCLTTWKLFYLRKSGDE